MTTYLEDRVQFLQEESSKLVPVEAYDSLKKAHDIQLLKLNEDLAYKSRLERQYADQLNIVAELNQSLRGLQIELDDRSSKLKKLESKLSEKEVELNNLREYVSRQTAHFDEIEDQKKKNYQQFLDAQTDAKINATEKKQLRVQIAELETEILQKRKRVVQLEGKVIELERTREENEDKLSNAKLELQNKERDLARCQELVSTLQDAHKKSMERANHLNQQLDIIKQQNVALKKELEIYFERETSERRERNEVMHTCHILSYLS